ncbi:PREDICTED: uncharacterized protein LOC108566428 [Nicrophorus vespilloides]|uniref:Uncharacterized protein LOC108566428 n=1 Tax=Nicrophorus vespilloides TaxID=110193 RepID=A0ABM1N4N0_NICVS|nr:PREDICTED: uncharacterized protein LOC108566428 [Nicrophorus vespilloides]
MRTKNFLIAFCLLVIVSLFCIALQQQKPTAIQNIVSTTHQQLRNFKDTLRDAEKKTFVADENLLAKLGFTKPSRLFPNDTWHNTTLPVIVTYVMEGQESQAIGLINNVGKLLPNNTVLVYNLGLGNYGLRTLMGYCNNSRCQVITYNLNEFPSHIQDDNFHAYRPIIIQDALNNVGAVFFMESSKRFQKHVTSEKLLSMYEEVVKNDEIVAWPMVSKNAVSSLTHKKMFDYFHTDTDNFLFLPMVSADTLLVVNSAAVHTEIMLPWVQCAFTHDCIVPIGAQSGGCRFDKKPQYRYSGCHSYDTSALNIILGMKFKLDNAKYTYQGSKSIFKTVPLERAFATLKGLEQNTTEDEIGQEGAA